MRKSKLYPVFYMFACTFILSLILIGFSRYTRERVEANRQLAFERAVFEAVGVELPGDRLELHNIFLERVKEPDANSGGAFKLLDGEAVSAYALPIEGQGFWAPIKGVIGIKTDRQTLLGLAIYEQKETPGLGAEIVQPEFKDQFSEENGKKISLEGEAFGIKPVGSELSDSEVYAITGATQTSTRFEKIVDEALKQWREKMLQ